MFEPHHSEKIPLSRSLLWILLSTLFISGSALMGYLYYLHVTEKRLQDDQYRIVAIVQRNSQQEGLKTSYLAELLDLSLDQPVNLYQFNTTDAEHRLLTCSLIKEATIQKIRPGTLYIQYQMRIPVAYLGDYSNTGIDAEGYVFPFRPFFTPKRLPIFYLGIDNLEGKWGSCLMEHERLKLAFKVLKQVEAFKDDNVYVKQIDVAEAYADSYGQRQVIVMLAELNEASSFCEGNQRVFLLRLNTEHYRQNLANFFSLKRQLIPSPVYKSLTKAEPFQVNKPVIIDLRIPHLAFIRKES